MTLIKSLTWDVQSRQFLHHSGIAFAEYLSLLWNCLVFLPLLCHEARELLFLKLGLINVVLKLLEFMDGGILIPVVARLSLQCWIARISHESYWWLTLSLAEGTSALIDQEIWLIWAFWVGSRRDVLHSSTVFRFMIRVSCLWWSSGSGRFGCLDGFDFLICLRQVGCFTKSRLDDILLERRCGKHLSIRLASFWHLQEHLALTESSTLRLDGLIVICI